MNILSNHYFRYLIILKSTRLWAISILIIFIPNLMNLVATLLSVNWMASISKFVEKYIFNDWNFLAYLVIAMGLDLLTGIRKAYINKELLLSKFLRHTINKAIQYFSFLIICGIIANFEIGGKRHGYADWLPASAFVYLILVEAKSVLENIYGIDKKFDVRFFIGVVQNLLKNVLGKKNDTNPQ